MNVVETKLATKHGPFLIVCSDEPANPSPDFALVRGSVKGRTGVLTRIQSECLTGHAFQSLSCDCNDQMQAALGRIAAEPSGILIYLRQEGRGIGLVSKLKSYILQKQGLDTVDANIQLGYAVDARSYANAAALLTHLGVASIRLLTNNPGKVDQLRHGGILVDDVEGLPPVVRDENRAYLATKVARMGHTFTL